MKTLLGGLLSAVAVLSIVGCAPVADEPPPAERSFELFLGDELGRLDWAWHRLRNTCLAEAGYSQNLDLMPTEPVNSYDALVVTARTFGPASEAEARRKGFGVDFPAEPARVISFDPDYDEELARCDQQAWNRIGPGAEDAYLSYVDLGDRLAGGYHRLLYQDLPKRIRDNLRECITAKGYRIADRDAVLRKPITELTGVPTGTQENPPHWQPDEKPGTIQVSPPVPVRKYVPTPEESDLAVAWLDCRRRTGLDNHLAEASTKLQAELVTANQEQFETLNPRIQAAARRAGELVAEA